ncbi:MAG TPA: reverse transcriptase domain-containing protein [Candidatus Nanoarchaeia archaeon]|nr:hypothetical protein [uncultured archaeon]AQS34193.1 hypothetical protein [uncultured archaeon]HLC56571.1 reverse transcriptase domain-containing protein [Candidatus Nanoarchaeia archaeon]
MKSYKNLYPKLCSYKNLELAFKKARKGKSSRLYVKEFEKDLNNNLLKLKEELETFEYKPAQLKKFIIRDPKTRTINKSDFPDRIVHHALVNILDEIYEKIFIYDSYANRINKGTSLGLKRLDKFKRKVSKNGKLIKYALNNNMVKGYCLKADIKHFFASVNQDLLIKELGRKVKDNKVLWLAKVILKNFEDQETGMPLGNMTSQFFSNVYLNSFDYFIKHELKVKYYLRYVDDFIILHENKEILQEYFAKINNYLKGLHLKLHPDKSKIFSMYKGVEFLGFKIFYNYRLLKNRNIKQFNKRLIKLKQDHEYGIIDFEHIINSIQGWKAYAKMGDTYNLRKSLMQKIDALFYLDSILYFSEKGQ